MSASVKAIAVGTDRDFVFGIIPALDPSGPSSAPGTRAVASHALTRLAAVAVFGRFVGRLPAEAQRASSGGAGVFLFGVLVLETIGGWFDPVQHGDNVPYLLLAAAEEACELTGVTIVLVVLLRYAERHVGVINVHLVDDRLGR